MITNRIYLFANFGNWPKQPYGGGEVGNRRTLSLLQKCNFEIKIIEKYQRVNNHSPLNLILLGLKMLGNIIKFFLTLFLGRRKNSIVHIVGFYGPMVYFENILVSISNLLGYFTVYEMRGGGADLYFKEGKKRYKKAFSHIIKTCNCIYSQGKENNSLILEISPDKDIFYYPNYVMKDFIPPINPQKPKDKINLVYFGRVSKTKNVDIVIDTFKILANTYDNIYLDIIGNCPEPEYAEQIKRSIKELGLEQRVNIHPACNHEKLKQHLKDKHFYLFPTKEPHEGHSNALTEAMAWGVIPIATSQGFNSSVINDKSLITKDLQPESFASIIKQIITDNRIYTISKDVYMRIQLNFTEDVILKNLKEKYDSLFSQISK